LAARALDGVQPGRRLDHVAGRDRRLVGQHRRRRRTRRRGDERDERALRVRRHEWHAPRDAPDARRRVFWRVDRRWDDLRRLRHLRFDGWRACLWVAPSVEGLLRGSPPLRQKAEVRILPIRQGGRTSWVRRLRTRGGVVSNRWSSIWLPGSSTWIPAGSTW